MVLADTLQRYSLAMQEKKTPTDCEVIARENGQAWQERYLSWIKEELGDVVQLETWDKWTSHKLFEGFINQIETCYQENRLFKDHIENDLQQFESRRRSSSHPNGFSETEKDYCRAYIKEECAVLRIWEYEQISLAYRIIIYPKKIPQAMTLIKHQYTQFKTLSVELHIPSSEKKSSFFSDIAENNHQENHETQYLNFSSKK